MKKRILVVDDAMFMRMMIRRALEEDGSCEIVGEAEDADEAIEKYKVLGPDLVTMDLTLTSSNGADAIRGIRDYDPEANIIVISAVDQRDILMETITLGVRDFIVKPFENERVRAAVSKALA